MMVWPMPLTKTRSSTLLNEPNRVRCVTIPAARASPTPEMAAARAFAEAVLMSTNYVELAVAEQKTAVTASVFSRFIVDSFPKTVLTDEGVARPEGFGQSRWSEPTCSL